MRRTILSLLLFCPLLAALTAVQDAWAQEPLTLDSCYAVARREYPAAKQNDLIEKSREYTIANASKGYYPQLNVVGQATYQSEVTSLPIKLPGVKVPELSKDQYKVYGELSQSIYDGGAVHSQKAVIEANTAVTQQSLEVELYKLRERVYQIYFGILMLDGQIGQVDLLKKDINTGIAAMTSAVANGIAFKSNLDALQAELLGADQRRTELMAARRSFLDMLGMFMNKTLADNEKFTKPAEIIPVSTLNRPELKLFDNQQLSLQAQQKIINARNMPKLGLFVQGGYGRPALNMLNNDFSPYYIGGIRFTWGMTGLYTLQNDRNLIEMNRKTVETQRETFLFNTNMMLKQQNNEIGKLKTLMQSDDQIIALRSSIKTSAKNQLQNGVISANDYVREVNAEDKARQNKLLHEIQMLMAEYGYASIAGN